MVPVVLSAVLFGLVAGGALSWAVRHSDSGPSPDASCSSDTGPHRSTGSAAPNLRECSQ